MGNPKKGTPAYEKKLHSNKVRRAAKRDHDLGNKPAVAKLVRGARAAARKPLVDKLRDLESVLDARSRRSNQHYRNMYTAQHKAAAAEAVAYHCKEQLKQKTTALKDARAELRETQASLEKTEGKLQKAKKATEKAEKALEEATAPWESWWRTLQVHMKYHLPPWAAKKVARLARHGPPRGHANDLG
ncbi:unnamed protein product [Prorocentrum cordatum]|uniref:Uncharacterized protein n=1 Tax=Prorocentrum cordatum TaxID=2364126 RepID=A0ABN9X5R0_9DINO|nr:unnamed protein product [Polarella glacialis]